MLYFWLRSDDLAEDHPCPMAPLASLRLGVVRVLELPPLRLLPLETAPSPSAPLPLYVLLLSPIRRCRI